MFFSLSFWSRGYWGEGLGGYGAGLEGEGGWGEKERSKRKARDVRKLGLYQFLTFK